MKKLKKMSSLLHTPSSHVGRTRRPRKKHGAVLPITTIRTPIPRRTAKTYAKRNTLFLPSPARS